MNKNHLKAVSLVIAFTFFLTGCQTIGEWLTDFRQEFIGLTMVVQSYDEEARLIDSVTGKSVSIERETEFDSQTAEGDSKADSQVLNIQVGGKTMTHVGSSLIAAEKGLEDLTAQVADQVELYETRSNLPFISRLQDQIGQTFFGKKKTIMIRSQNGTPLAVYSGNKVSYFKTDVPKSTGLLIDGRYLFVYRCDYTIYDNELLEKN